MLRFQPTSSRLSYFRIISILRHFPSCQNKVNTMGSKLRHQLSILLSHLTSSTQHYCQLVLSRVSCYSRLILFHRDRFDIIGRTTLVNFFYRILVFVAVKAFLRPRILFISLIDSGCESFEDNQVSNNLTNLWHCKELI